MTLVAALRAETRVVIMSDTAIYNRDAVRRDVIPGRLKCIVLNSELTVAYAGLSSQALDVIRQAKRERLNANQTAELLVCASDRYGGEIDFLLCSHEDKTNPRLLKIADSRVYEGANYYWIGNAASARALASYECNYTDSENAADFQSANEREFTHRFFEYMHNNADPHIGGAIVNCLCSSYGHCYQDHAGAHSWNIVLPNTDSPDVTAALHRTGRDSFSYHVYSPADRGIALVGFYMEQPCVGFLHIPLRQDDPVAVFAKTEAEFRRIVSEAAKELSD